MAGRLRHRGAGSAGYRSRLIQGCAPDPAPPSRRKRRTDGSSGRQRFAFGDFAAQCINDGFVVGLAEYGRTGNEGVGAGGAYGGDIVDFRSEEHTSELQSLMST